MTKFWVGFIAIHLVLSAFFLDTKYSPNPISRALPILTFYEEGTLSIDKYKIWTNDKSQIGDRYYSDKAPLPTFLVLPLYGVLRIFGLDKVRPEKFKTYPISLLGGVVCGTIPFVLMLWLTCLGIKGGRRKASPAPVTIAALAFYGSYLFVYSGTYFNHLLAAALLLGSYITMKQRKNFALAGCFLGAAVLSEYTVALICVIWAIQILLKENARSLAGFAAGIAPWAVAGAIYNRLLTGSFLKTVNAFHADPSFSKMHQSYGFGHPTPESLWGLTFSPFRGVFFYAPVLIVALILYFKRNYTGLNWKKLLLSYWLMATAATVLVMSSHFTWDGGWCYGPRYLIPVTALMLYEAARFLARKRFSRPLFFAISFFGLLGVWLSKSTSVYMFSSSYRFPLRDPLLSDFLSRKFNTDNLLTMLFGMNAAYVPWIWLGLFLAALLVLDVWYRKELAG